MNKYKFKKYYIVLIIFCICIIFFIGYFYKEKNDVEYSSNFAFENGKTYEISFDLSELKEYDITYRPIEYQDGALIGFLNSYFKDEGISLPDDFEKHIIIKMKE